MSDHELQPYVLV